MALIGFFKFKKGCQQAFYQFVWVFIEEINRASFGSVYKSSKYAMLHTEFTILFNIMKCAFIEQNNLSKVLKSQYCF